MNLQASNLTLIHQIRKCHSHNKGLLMQKYTFIPARDFSFILCKYMYFICFVENLRTSLRKIYGRINEKSRAGINGYFYIQKTLHFNENCYLWSIKEQNRQEGGQKEKETSNNREQRQRTQLNICVFKCQHLFSTTFALIFCSDADYALVFGAIWDKFASNQVLTEH